MKSKSLYNIVLATLTTVGALGISSEVLAREKDVYESLIKTGKAEAGAIYRLGKEDRAFDFFNAKTVINGRVLDIKSEGFQKLLQINLGPQGDKIYEFLSQENASNFGITTAESDRVIIYSQVGSKIISTPDDSIETNILEVNGKAANVMSNIVRNKNSTQTALIRASASNGGSGVVFDLKGISPESFNHSLRLNVRKGFKLNPFMRKDELEKFTDESGIRTALNDFLGYEDVSGLTKDPMNDVRVTYQVEDSKAKIYFSVVRNNTALISSRGPYESNLVSMPKESFDCSNPKDVTVLGLEDVVVASAEPYRLTEVPDTAVVVPDTTAVKASVRGLGFVGKKEESDTSAVKKSEPKPTIIDYVIGAGYNPVRGIVGVQRSSGKFICGVYGGISESGEDQEAVSQSNVSALGNRHEISRDWHEDRIGWFASGDLGYRISKEFSVVAGVDLGVDRLRLSGKASPRVYDKDGKVIGRSSDQVISERDLRKMLRPNVGAQYRGVSGKYSYDVKRKKHGVQVTFPIIRGIRGAKK